MPGHVHNIITQAFKKGTLIPIKNYPMTLKKVHWEISRNGYIPDLTCKVEEYDKDLLIEVIVTNKLSLEKRNEYINSNELAVAINLNHNYSNNISKMVNSRKTLEIIIDKATFINNPYEKIQFKDGTKENYEVQYNLSLNRDDFLVKTETKCCLIVCERGKIPEYEIEIVKNIAKQRPISYVRMKENDNFKNCLATKKALPLW